MTTVSINDLDDLILAHRKAATALHQNWATVAALARSSVPALACHAAAARGLANLLEGSLPVIDRPARPGAPVEWKLTKLQSLIDELIIDANIKDWLPSDQATLVQLTQRLSNFSR